ncbi:hypothetical protein [Streptosporangium vulgare]|uniref:hypothetical protein n=1 Tax=Streptosporangium vulgare TaxID=46190 RepID=UPI0031D9E492
MDGSPARLVREFHEKRSGSPSPTPPGLPSAELARLRQRFLDEEVAEVAQAAEAGDLAGVAHELADVVYVAYGTALTYGIDLDRVPRRGAPGQHDEVRHRERQGPPRGRGFTPADVAGVLAGEGSGPGESAAPDWLDRLVVMPVEFRIARAEDVPLIVAMLADDVIAASRQGAFGDEHRAAFEAIDGRPRQRADRRGAGRRGGGHHAAHLHPGHLPSRGRSGCRSRRCGSPPACGDGGWAAR